MAVEDRLACDGGGGEVGMGWEWRGGGEVGMGWAWRIPACALCVCACATLRLWDRVREHMVATGQNHEVNHSQFADLRESNMAIGNP